MDETLRKRLAALTAAGRAQSLDFEGVAARVATDRFVALEAPDAADRARYEDMMRGAVAHMDEPTAQRIAETLARCPAAPAAVLADLIAHGPESAARVLELAPALPAALLLDRAIGGDAREAAAVAAREDIDSETVGALVRRLEPEVLRALAANGAASIDRGALITLTQRARLDLELGRLLLARHRPALDRTALFLSADPAMRRRLLLDAARAALSHPGDALGALDAVRIEAMAAAEAGDRPRFCAVVARALRVARATIDRLALDAGGEPLGLIFAAMGLAATESERPVLALRRDLATALADPMSGLRFALQAPPPAAAAIISALTPGRPRPAGEYGRAQPGPRRTGANAGASDRSALAKLNRA